MFPRSKISKKVLSPTFSTYLTYRMYFFVNQMTKQAFMIKLIMVTIIVRRANVSAGESAEPKLGLPPFTAASDVARLAEATTIKVSTTLAMKAWTGNAVGKSPAASSFATVIPVAAAGDSSLA